MSTNEVAVTEPDVQISLEENGVQVRVTARFAGVTDEWTGQQAGEWFGFLWEELRGMANLHCKYRIRDGSREVPTVSIPDVMERMEITGIDRELPEMIPVEAELELPRRGIVEVPGPPPSRTGQLAGVSKAGQQRIIKQEEDAMARFIWGRQDCEATKLQIVKAFPGKNESWFKQRLYGLQKREIIGFRLVPGGRPKFGFWFITAKGKDILSSRTPEVVQPHPLTEVLPQTRGKTWLMLGGDATRERVLGIEATFQLEKLNWPTFYDEQPVEMRLREIERPEVDLVLCNRWNRRYSRHYQHKARECGKPFVMLTRGINPAQIAEQLRRQPLPVAA